MPSKATVDRARKDLRQGKRPTTAAGEFVREELEHIRQGKHGARSSRQAIAIGLSQARRAGVPLPAPGEERASAQARRKARRDTAVGAGRARSPSRRRSAAVTGALKREPRAAASHAALSRQASAAAKRRRARGAASPERHPTTKRGSRRA
jgi:hypothetical protein